MTQQSEDKAQASANAISNPRSGRGAQMPTRGKGELSEQELERLRSLDLAR
jgi:hypothetical protein